ncbi:MAG: tRNA (N(6)-L-threonylcarbamoyladenosine(37)-C(2))-methylthiotransferase MtaB [Rickettsiales bacterium]|nr:tRNA (N(6)-L-threonylcarbamoyladenosine(37)-C(2))-methylthiotransferase MtaB [Rickettsiales bacterium]
MSEKKSKVLNLGCRLNYFESQVIQNILDTNNLKNTIVVNTCAVTNQAVTKSINEIKKAKKRFPNHELIVTGCASQIDKNRFKSLNQVHRIIDNNFKTSKNSYISDNKVSDNEIYKFPAPPENFEERTRASLQIQQGCNHRCTFCIIPFGRGDAISLPVGEISSRLGNLIDRGYKEVTLTGVDLTSFGDDLPGKPKLGSVLKRLLKIHPKLNRLRLSSIDPAEMDEDLLYLFKYEKRLLPYLHLSIQSGDNLILKRMKRRHSTEDVIDICRKIKKVRKEIKFGADIIVGFPTETNENFNNTIKLAKQCRFSNLHLFKFSPKNGTPASKMPQIQNNVKNFRFKKLRNIYEKIKSEQMKEKLGTVEEILFESEKQSYTNDYFKVSLLKKKFKEKEKSKFGNVVKVKILSKRKDRLFAELV